MVWFLLIIGILLVFFNIRAMKKEKSSFGVILHNSEKDMKDYEVRLGEVRREFAETILELQKEILELKKSENNDKNIIEDKITENKVEEEQIIAEDVFENDFNDIEVKEESQDAPNTNSVKIDEINNLLKQGFSVEDVSEKLGIGKGEVLLIKELYLK